MPSEMEMLEQLGQLIKDAELAFANWANQTAPANVQYEVSQTSGEIFALHLLRNELRLNRLEMIRQSILTRHALGQFAVMISAQVSSRDTPSPPNPGENPVTQANDNSEAPDEAS